MVNSEGFVRSISQPTRMFFPCLTANNRDSSDPVTTTPSSLISQTILESLDCA